MTSWNTSVAQSYAGLRVAKCANGKWKVGEYDDSKGQWTAPMSTYYKKITGASKHFANGYTGIDRLGGTEYATKSAAIASAKKLYSDDIEIAQEDERIGDAVIKAYKKQLSDESYTRKSNGFKAPKIPSFLRTKNPLKFY